MILTSYPNRFNNSFEASVVRARTWCEAKIRSVSPASDPPSALFVQRKDSFSVQPLSPEHFVNADTMNELAQLVAVPLVLSSQAVQIGIATPAWLIDGYKPKGVRDFVILPGVDEAYVVIVLAPGHAAFHQATYQRTQDGLKLAEWETHSGCGSRAMGQAMVSPIYKAFGFVASRRLHFA